MTHIRRTRFMLAAQLACCSAAVAAGPEYELFIIEPFVAGSTAEAVAFAVNNAGQATGYATNPNTRPYLWSMDGGKVDLGTPSGAASCAGADINSAGVVAGWAGSVATVWWGVNDFQQLPAPAGAFFPFAFGVNDANIVVGKANLSANVTTGFVWDATNGSRDLRSLGVTNAWNARRVSNASHVIGQRLASNFVAYRFDLGTGQLITLGTLGGPQSEPLGLNNLGEVVGWAHNPNLNTRAFRWTPVTGMQDLGSLGGQPYDLARAYDVNDQGRIVGVSTVASGPARAFIWDQDSGMRDLNELVDAPQFRLEAAQMISDTGWIAGNGRFTSGGLGRGFVLKPIGTGKPCATGDVNCDGGIDFDDILAVLFAWGDCPTQGQCVADVNHDGVVNFDDVLLVLFNWP